jgi:hypothetical protein
MRAPTDPPPGQRSRRPGTGSALETLPCASRARAQSHRRDVSPCCGSSKNRAPGLTRERRASGRSCSYGAHRTSARCQCPQNANARETSATAPRAAASRALSASRSAPSGTLRLVRILPEPETSPPSLGAASGVRRTARARRGCAPLLALTRRGITLRGAVSESTRSSRDSIEKPRDSIESPRGSIESPPESIEYMYDERPLEVRSRPSRRNCPAPERPTPPLE